jgi:hypothetical protein
MGTQILAEHIELLENTINADAKTVDVVLIRPGWSKNGRYYSRDVLAKSASLFEGVKAYANHPTRDQIKRGEGRSVLDITGDYTSVRLGESGEIRATRTVYGKAGDAVWPLIERAVETKRAIVGVSINALGKASKGKVDGRDGVIVESIEVANSADDVDTPAAGGEFTNLLMGDSSLTHDLLQALSYDEYVEARPDYIETVRKQQKRARQDDTVRTLTSERDAALTALAESKANTTQHQADLEVARAETARLRQQIAVEKAFREANFNNKLEALLRKRLDKAETSDWLGILADARAEMRAAAIKPDPVTVHGAPLRESRTVTPAPQADTATIDMSVYNTPDKLQAEMSRRAAMRK